MTKVTIDGPGLHEVIELKDNEIAEMNSALSALKTFSLRNVRFIVRSIIIASRERVYGSNGVYGQNGRKVK